MRLLKVEFNGDDLFKDEVISLDLYAQDKVSPGKGGRGPSEVHRVRESSTVYSLNVIGIGGVNAAGKTTTLKLLSFAFRVLTADCIMRGFPAEFSRMPAKLKNRFEMRAIFFHNDSYYYLDSLIAVDDLDDRDSFHFVDEELWRARPYAIRKKDLETFSRFQEKAEPYLRRTPNPDWDAGVVADDVLKALGRKASIVRLISSDTDARVISKIGLEGKSHPSSVIQVFDSSVEHLTWDEDSEVFRLKFKGEPERFVSRAAAASMLSSGTVSGAELVENAIAVLSTGSYMIVDEVESHLNKSLVVAVMDLFISPATNPKGATLIFSTHYLEILDELGRKDDLYLLVRDESCRSSLVKYRDKVSRVENKKSEALLSGLIKGANPSYPLVRDMRSFVRDAVNG